MHTGKASLGDGWSRLQLVRRGSGAAVADAALERVLNEPEQHVGRDDRRDVAADPERHMPRP